MKKAPSGEGAINWNGCVAATRYICQALTGGTGFATLRRRRTTAFRETGLAAADFRTTRLALRAAGLAAALRVAYLALRALFAFGFETSSAFTTLL